jgi:DNA-binding NarL/FixJ family response regulator
MPIKITITDDHPLVISGLQSMLAHYPNIYLINSFASGTALLAGIQVQVPDVLLLDIQMPHLTGDALVPLLLKKIPGLKIIALTNFDSALYASNMFKLGIHGYVLKNAEAETIIKAIETVYDGGVFVEDAMQQKIDHMEDKIVKSVSRKVSLTPREKDVLQHIVDGETNQEIAESLFLSVRTVENYRLNIQLKLDAKNTAILVKKVLQMGLLDT